MTRSGLGSNSSSTAIGLAFHSGPVTSQTVADECRSGTLGWSPVLGLLRLSR